MKTSIIYCLLTLLLTTENTLANIRGLVSEYLNINSELKVLKSKHELAEFNYELKSSSKDLNLIVSTGHTKSNLEDSISFRTTELVSKEIGLNLSKSFFWGGKLTLTNAFATNEVNAGTSYSSFSQSLIFTQALGANFFGRNEKIDLGIAKRNIKYEKTKLVSAQEDKVLVLINNLLSSFESFQLKKLYEKAYKRSVQRENMIRKRVKDGLNHKADLYSATVARLFKQEEVQTQILGLNRELNKIETLLHRKVEHEEISVIKFNYKVQNKVLSNHKLKLILDSKDESLLKINQIKNSLIPKITFSGSYFTNDYNSDRMETIQSGNLLGEQNGLKVELKMNWQIGNASTKIQKSMSTIKLENIKYNETQLTKNLQLNYEYLITNQKQRASIISISKKRVGLADRTLSEYLRLYKNGRADLDQIIRSEETLIETQKALLRSQVENKRLLFSIASLNGELLKSIQMEKMQ